MMKRLIIIATLVLLWQMAAEWGVLNPLIVGTPLMIAQAAKKNGLIFIMALRVTLFEMICACALAWSSGLIIGMICGANKCRTLCVTPLISAMIAVPLVVLYPVIVAWAGIGPISKIIYGAAAGFFPMTLSVINGVNGIDQRYVVMARAMGASRLTILIDIYARFALPSIMSGLRIGTSLLIIAIIQSEMLSATDGLGFWISYYRSLFAVGDVYFGVILVLCIAAFINHILSYAEQRLRFTMI